MGEVQSGSSVLFECPSLGSAAVVELIHEELVHHWGSSVWRGKGRMDQGGDSLKFLILICSHKPAEALNDLCFV